MFEARIKADFTNLESLVGKYPDAAKAARVSKLTQALMLVERAVKQRTPEGAGPMHLRDTIFGRTSILGRQVHGILGTPARYGESVEMGTRPHFPPVDPIRHWVERKLRISGDEAKGVAFLIARAISRRGTKGAHMFDKGFEVSKSRIMEILNGIPDEIVRKLNS